MKLQGKKALVTGASAGIGRAIAWAYAQEGADVAIHYNSSSEAAEELRQEMVQSFGTKAICIRADLGSDEDVHHMISTAMEELGEDYYDIIHVRLVRIKFHCDLGN